MTTKNRMLIKSLCYISMHKICIDIYIYVLYITAQCEPISLYRTKLYVDTFDQQ